MLYYLDYSQAIDPVMFLLFLARFFSYEAYTPLTGVLFLLFCLFTRAS